MSADYTRGAGLGVRFGQGGVQVQSFGDANSAVEPFPYRENFIIVQRTVATPISFVMPAPNQIEIGNCSYVLEDDGAVAITLALGTGDTNTLLNGVNASHVLPVLATKRLTFIYTHGVHYSIVSVPFA